MASRQKKTKSKEKKSKTAHLKQYAFKPGRSGNPEGRPKLPEDILRARAHSREELERAVLRIVWQPAEYVEAQMNDMGLPMIERIIAKLTMNSFNLSNLKMASFLLDRAGFPVKRDDRPSIPNLLASMPIEQLLKLAVHSMEILRSGDTAKVIEVDMKEEGGTAHA